MKKHLSRLTALLLALILLLAPAFALNVDQALELLEALYYYDIPEEAYKAKTVEELLQVLSDPYTQYMTEQEYQTFLKALEGDADIVGIGVSVQYTFDGILILDTISGGSAREAGLQPGDLIVAVDGVPCVPASASVSDLLTGAEGTQVTVTILRDGVTSSYALTRRPVVIPNTEIQILDGGIGYIDCNSFGLDTGAEFAQLVEENDGKVGVWLLDLRGNGGGYVTAAAELLSALMGVGRYVYFEYGDGSLEYVPGLRDAATAKPVIVLTDGASASASELVSSNVRDLGRGITVGLRTYGKGVAQSMLDEGVLPDYFDGDCLKLTTSRAYSGGANTTDRIGVIPTLLVDSVQTASLALALCGDPDESQLSILMDAPGAPGNRRSYGVDLDKVDNDTLSALLSALPPQIVVGYSETAGGEQERYTPAQIAEILGVEYENRWFTDVGGSRYADAINAMGVYGLLEGDGRGSFNPEGQLTRAQLCTMLARVINVTYQGASLFSDVDQDSWYGPSVNAMAYLGLVEGTGDGKFSPDKPLTQEQFLTIMGRTARFINVGLDAYGQWLEDGEGRLSLAQQMALAPYSDWAEKNVAVLAWGLEETFDDVASPLGMLYAPLSELSPGTPTLREEAAAGMYAVLSGLHILPRQVS